MAEKILKYCLVVVMLLPLGCDITRAARLPGLMQEEPAQQPRQPQEGMEMEYLDAKLEVEVPVKDTAEEEEEEAQLADPADEEDAPLTVVEDSGSPYLLEGKKVFNPDPTRAVWLSALFPGLGQIYNRRYWKLPIIVAGYMGLAYGTSWNARMFQDYQRAYADIMDDDPDTKSYLDFFPPTVDESSLDKTWLTQVLKSRKDYYRRNRDLCIICCVGLYLLAMLDAYVDASLTHFDVSDDLSLDVAPSILITPGSSRPTPALQWAFTF